MEMAVYNCYEQEPRSFEIDDRARFETYELKGKVRDFMICNNHATIKIGRKYYDLKSDDVTKTASEKHKKGDSLTITVCVDSRDKRYNILASVVSVVNHTQNFTVVNRKLSTIMAIQAETLKRHEQHHNLLKDALCGGDLLVLVKRLYDVKGYCYELISVCNEHRRGLNVAENVSEMLKEAGITDAEASKKTGFRINSFNDVYGHEDYLIGNFRVAEKTKDCSHCGEDAYGKDGRNHSIVVGCGSYKEKFYCEYCFFDDNRIRVPQHLLDAANKNN